MPRKSMTLLCAGWYFLAVFLLGVFLRPSASPAAEAIDYEAIPPFVTAGVPPLVMLVMGRDHKLYYEAYNDASDLNGDGDIDVGYDPGIDYYGYFDSFKYYQYNGTDQRFDPAGLSADKKAPSGDYWSGDFLNYLTMSRMDCVRKVLYGGMRSTDTAALTVLQRAYIPQDAHSWGKEYTSIGHDGYDIRDYTPLNQPLGGSRHLFASTTHSDNGDPLLRVLQNSVFRIWEWVAIERPVAGSQGNDGTGRRTITDNNVEDPGDLDVTEGGSAGTVSDSGAGNRVIKYDGFDDGSDLDDDWNWYDNDGSSNTDSWQSGGLLSIDANGTDVWTGDDRYAARYLDNISGDFDFKLKINAQERQNGWGKTGIMVRDNIRSPGSSDGYCIIAITPDNGITFQWDSNNNGYLDQNVTRGSSSPKPIWVRLTKVGTRFTGYYRYDSDPADQWVEVRSADLSSANAVQDVGIFVSSHRSGVLSLCTFGEADLRAPGSEPGLAFDDNTGTEWQYAEEPSSGDPAWIQFTFDGEKEIQSYTITAGSDAPARWALLGSTDGSTWSIVDSVSSAGLSAGTKQEFECDTPGVYTHYRLVITASSSDSVGLSIEEIEMMENTDLIPPDATLDDYHVRVKVCDPDIGLEPNAKLYPDGNYKPIGILQRHGESDRMYFGLVAGSYTKNTSGGVLRQNIHSIRNEVNAGTGEFSYMDDANVKGIIKTVDRLRVVDFNYANNYQYDSNCGWITTAALAQGQCRMWGNPIAEMMYEGLRYFAGERAATSAFTYGTDASYDDNELGLPKPGWLDPYVDGEDLNRNGSLDTGEDLNGNGILDGFEYCAKPFMLVLSDIYPSYDSDQLPGSAFNSFTGSATGPMAGLNVETLADTISTHEGESGSYFIGDTAGSAYDGSCAPKNVTGFGDVRGLCPEEPTKKGSYYSASVAFHGNTVDFDNDPDRTRQVASYFVGLASPLPEIRIPVGEGLVTLVPFAKSVGGCYSVNGTQGAFQPTNTIVDFFVEEITPTYGKWRINYEDVEQGADHDMDVIVEYIYTVLDDNDHEVADPALGTKVRLTLNSTYAAGCIKQHMGYIISGTESADGTYLVVRDIPDGYNEGDDPDVDYFLDTPPGVSPGGSGWDDDAVLGTKVERADGTFYYTDTRTFTPGDTDGAGLMKNPLWYAAKWGGFEDANGNNLPDNPDEWDKDGDGTPDTYFYVQNPLKLEQQLNRSFADILRRTASGTAASIVSQTRSGEGALYQAVFYTEYKGPLGNTINWSGQIHALFVDAYGNMREDTNQNMRLDIEPYPSPQDTDRIIVFDGNQVKKYRDAEGDFIIADGQEAEQVGTILDIDFLWSSSTFLNEMTDTEAVTQRVYNQADRKRYIFTFADADNDMVVDSGEQVPFTCDTLPQSADLTDTTKFYPYLNLFPTFEDEQSMPITYDGADSTVGELRGTDLFQEFLTHQTERLVHYIRGKDQAGFTREVSGHNFELVPFRSRKVDYDDDGALETWRLGDVVYSTPTAVGRPSENYDFLYQDGSYAAFAARYQNRRQVVYAGANDGMLHAFNAGFYDPKTKGFKTHLTNETPHALGAELWAYVPYNLLPHLYWLTDINYPHVYYCDLRPKIFDAKVLPDDTHYTDADSEPNWGTFLIGGMRLGGGQIVADMDKNGLNENDRTMSSAYFILDITDPEVPPTLLAEIRFDSLGYTTCYPTVMPMKDKDHDTGVINQNEWFVVFGSGPAAADGTADVNDTAVTSALTGAISKQNGKLFVLDFGELVLNSQLRTLDSSGTPATPTPPDLPAAYQILPEADSFVSDPISVDYDLDFSADVVYFGTVIGDSESGWGGMLRRVVTNDDIDPANWDGDSVLIDLDPVSGTGQPIVSGPSAGMDNLGRRWVFFGTGRFYVRDFDATNTDPQSFYGLKEPFTDSNGNGLFDEGELDWGTIPEDKSSLLNVSNAEIYSDRTVTGVSLDAAEGAPVWEDLVAEIDNPLNDGWYLDFSQTGERNLGQAALLGGLLTFTTYIPTIDPCSFEGDSNLYAAYYKTGTAFTRPAIGVQDIDGGTQKIIRKLPLGRGLTTSPTIHVGRQEGATAFVQLSTGEIVTIDEMTPVNPKSGITAWEEIKYPMCQ